MTTLRPVLIRLYAAIEGWMHDRGCSPSIRQLAYKCQMDRRQVKRLLPELVKAGLITWSPGVSFSIAMTEAMANFSTDELLRDLGRTFDELSRRGYGEEAARVAVCLQADYPVSPPYPRDDESDFSDIFHQLEGIDGQGDGGEEDEGAGGGAEEPAAEGCSGPDTGAACALHLPGDLARDLGWVQDGPGLSPGAVVREPDQAGLDRRAA